MPTILISITSLLLGIGILLVGHGLAGTLLTLRAAVEGYSASLIGLIMAAYFAGYIAGTVYCPGLINRIGHIRTFTVAAALAGSLVIIHGLIIDPWIWLVARFIYGICVVAIYLVIESWLNVRANNTLRGRVFAVYMLVDLVAMAAGQQLLLVGTVQQLELFAIAAALFSLGLLPIALTRIPEPERVATGSVNLKQLYHTSPIGLFGCLAAGLIGGAFWTLGPLFAHQTGLTATGVAAFMSMTILGGAILQWPVGLWSDRIDRRKVLAAASFGAAGVALISAFVSSMPMWAMLTVMFIYGGLYFVIYPLSIAYSNDRSDPGQFITLSSSLLLTYGIGATLGPLLGGILMQFSGPRSLPVFYSVCLLALGLFTLNQIKNTKPVAPENTNVFVPLVRTSPIALQVESDEVEPASVTELDTLGDL